MVDPRKLEEQGQGSLSADTVARVETNLRRYMLIVSWQLVFIIIVFYQTPILSPRYWLENLSTPICQDQWSATLPYEQKNGSGSSATVKSTTNSEKLRENARDTFSRQQKTSDKRNSSSIKPQRNANRFQASHSYRKAEKRFSRFGKSDSLLVQKDDSIYRPGRRSSNWDSSPVVIESHKLIFFTVAKNSCTVWKQLFRRMMGYRDWQVGEGVDMIPWNPEKNGLKYLYDYDRETASEMMESLEWTKAIFVREPKERFVSAFLDKAFHKNFVGNACCSTTWDCVKQARSSPSGFLDVIRHCSNPHWNPQSSFIPAKYWPYINFVGHMETLQEDARRLLTGIGAWEEFGKSGYGQDGTEPIFTTKAVVKHATNAKGRIKQYISQELEERLDEFYADDYKHPVLKMEKLVLYDESEASEMTA
jgi:hypothetical protein